MNVGSIDSEMDISHINFDKENLMISLNEHECWKSESMNFFFHKRLRNIM